MWGGKADAMWGPDHWPGGGKDRIDTMIFFLQAEDGIRDCWVTGVQTCALPIWDGTGRFICRPATSNWRAVPSDAAPTRSEERRVGKEGRSRWAPYHLKKKMQMDGSCGSRDRTRIWITAPSVSHHVCGLRAVRKA